MFAKPEWFRPGPAGWRLVPQRGAGFVYLATWMVVLLIPAAVLAYRDQWLETTIWCLALGAGWAWDLWDLRRSTPTSIEWLDAVQNGESQAETVATEQFVYHIKS